MDTIFDMCSIRLVGIGACVVKLQEGGRRMFQVEHMDIQLNIHIMQRRKEKVWSGGGGGG
jgi:hypothetical protein